MPPRAARPRLPLKNGSTNFPRRLYKAVECDYTAHRRAPILRQISALPTAEHAVPSLPFPPSPISLFRIWHHQSRMLLTLASLLIVTLSVGHAKRCIHRLPCLPQLIFYSNGCSLCVCERGAMRTIHRESRMRCKFH